ncbi:MAG TPA: prepilin-type N-terminal cleavage/methylation domain-containing protein [Kofleriaceae bacterium]|nr:prepilin-type N-terminal cleavage/methylation domain-containing protein [Kofleriaceae bacterium]
MYRIKNSAKRSAAHVPARGFTLIELMVVVAIIGVLTSVAVPKFLGYMKTAKSTEAVVHLGAIAKAADSSFIENATYPQVVSALTPAQSCCQQGGKKCAVAPADWDGVPAWDELGFEMTQPFYFQYQYTSVLSSAYQADAVGDLDCDGITVTYMMKGDASTGAPKSTLIKPVRAD